MQLQDIAISDGRLESVRTSLTDAEIIFVDWNEVRWRFTFTNVLAVENLNIEGEELDRLEVSEDHPYIERVRSVVDEPNESMKIFMFYTSWKDEPRLCVVAGGCVVNGVDKPSHSA